MHRPLTRLAATYRFPIALAALFAPEAAAFASVTIMSEHPLARRPVEGEHLIRSVVNGETRLLVRQAEAASGVPALPFLADLRGYTTAVPFGVEERCVATRAGPDIEISCAPGSATAGTLIRFNGRLPRGAAAEAVIDTRSTQGFRAQIVPPGSDADAPVLLSGEQRLSLAGGDQGRAELVILAPPGEGSLRISGLRLSPTVPARPHGAGAWVWEPALWRDGGEALIRNAGSRQLKRLFITLEIEDGRVQHLRELRRFIRSARTAGIMIEAVEGDPRMVLEGGLANGLSRARAIARYQKEAPRHARLAAIQYDIEPYVLPEWGRPPVDYGGWSAAVNALARAAGEPVHLALPFWVAEGAGGAGFLREVRASIRSVTAMTYRTDPALVTVLAEPLLHWGNLAGVPVRLALESGPVSAEAEEAFEPAATGTIALIEKNGATIALQLAREGVFPGARMYRSRGAVEVRPEKISFLGDEAGLLRAARQLAPAFSAWRSYAGISFHGLRWSAHEGTAR
jgi:hypothetical protein